MNILVTGGTGFIGSRLVKRCLERGDKVKVLGELNTDAEKVNKNSLEKLGVECIIASINSTKSVETALKDVDVVFHLAAAQHEMNIPDKRFYEVNVDGTKNLIKASIKNGIKRFVHGSTIGVYGKMSGIIDEETPCNPDNIYGTTKLEGEKLALTFADQIPISIVRIPEVYGPGDRRLLKLFKAIHNKKFFVIGSGSNLHHLIYVDDLIDGMFLISESDESVGRILLLASENPLTTREMAEEIADAMESRLPRWNAPLWPFTSAAIVLEKLLRPLGIQPPLHRRRMDFFIKSFELSTKRAAALIDFKAKTSFAKGVAETATWYQQNGLLSNSNKNHDQIFSHMLTGSKQTARLEPFDSFWEAPSDIEKGYKTFGTFYQVNYLPHVPKDKNIHVLVISCGPGYFLNLLKTRGYENVLGIDCDDAKIEYAKKKGFRCIAENAFDFLQKSKEKYDLIIAEQELNHLTKQEMIEFLKLCKNNLAKKGRVIVHSLNGANPITSSEALAQNFDHYNTLTEYSIKQVLHFSGFSRPKAFPLKLYVFYHNPLNYVAIIVDFITCCIFKFYFKLYGKNNKIFTKKIGAVAFLD